MGRIGGREGWRRPGISISDESFMHGTGRKRELTIMLVDVYPSVS